MVTATAAGPTVGIIGVNRRIRGGLAARRGLRCEVEGLQLYVLTAELLAGSIGQEHATLVKAAVDRIKRELERARTKVASADRGHSRGAIEWRYG